MGKLKDQLAGIAALIGVLAAIGGGFIKYGEITTKLIALEEVSRKVDLFSFAVLEEKIKKLENADTSHTHDTKHSHDETDIRVVEKEIELLKVQMEEIKANSTNPLAN
tara:strand:- start:28 stop:351 length:324 start_codon:yes stop_codon:yes gene_type:complete